jgi:hypothetical protein
MPLEGAGVNDALLDRSLPRGAPVAAVFRHVSDASVPLYLSNQRLSA